MARNKKKKTQLKRNYDRDAGVAATLAKQSHSFSGRTGTKADLQATIAHQVGTLDSGDDYETLSQIALTNPDDFSADMLKYWRQRYRLFSLFDGSSPGGELPLLDREGWYSVTPEPIAARIAQRCRNGVILDAFCGVGGNAIQFALTCERVIAIDTDLNKLRLARHNARIYGVEQFITFLHGDWRDFANDWLVCHGERAKEHTESASSSWQGCEELNIDVIFLSPPWGGVDYRQLPSPSKGGVDETFDATSAMSLSDEAAKLAGYYPLSALAPSGAHEMLSMARAMTPNVCLYVPRNVSIGDLAELAAETAPQDKQGHHSDSVSVAIEEQWLSGQCKALSCYFGDLIDYDPEG